MNDIELSRAPVWVQPVAGFIRRLPAGRYRLMNWLPRHAGDSFWMRMSNELGGLSFQCNLKDSIAREVCFTGQYEPQDTALVRSLVERGMTFVDVGANWGYYTLLAAHLVGESGRVISMEPDPRLFPILVRNIGHNQLSNVTAIQVAAADKSGTLSLAGYKEDDDNRGLSKLVDKGEQDATTFDVKARSVDAILDELRIGTIDLLKMDIEGAEELALRGMLNGLSSHRYDRILLELHPSILADRGLTPEDVVGLMTGAGYTGWRLDFSPEANRKAAYASVVNVWDYLSPLSDVATLDSWPHILWLAPGVDLPK